VPQERYADEESGIRNSRSESSSALRGDHVVWKRHAQDSSSSSKCSSEESGMSVPASNVLFLNDSTSGDSSSQSGTLGAIASASRPSEGVDGIDLPQSQRTEALRTLPYDELANLLPIDAEGEPTSIGSLDHDLHCNPCAFMIRSRGCKQGVYCRFCHLPHSGEIKKNRPRPCQKQRIRFKNTLDQLKAKVEESPETFNADEARFPASIERNTEKREKVRAILKDHQLQTIALNVVDKYHEDKAAPSKFSL
jgi:hypothetical protein